MPLKFEGHSILITQGDYGAFTVRSNTVTIDPETKIQTKTPRPLVPGDVVKFSVKRSKASSIFVLQKIITTFVEVEEVIELLHTDTTSLPYSKYLYDVELKPANGQTVTILGPDFFTVTEDI